MYSVLAGCAIIVFGNHKIRSSKMVQSLAFLLISNPYLIHLLFDFKKFVLLETKENVYLSKNGNEQQMALEAASNCSH